MVHSRRVTVARTRPPGLHLPGEGLDVGAADGEQAQGTGAAPGGELPQVQRIRLPGQAAVSSQEPGEGEPFGIGEGRLDHDERSGPSSSGPSGTSRPGWNPEALGQLRVSAVERNLNVSRVSQSQHVTAHPVGGR